MDSDEEFLTITEAARQLGTTPGQVRRLLRQFGLGDLISASMRKQVLIRRSDLPKLRSAVRRDSQGRGAA